MALINTNMYMTKKYLMTLAAIFCCAMTMAVLHVQTMITILHLVSTKRLWATGSPMCRA